MDFISIPVTFGIVAFFIYKFFELLICRKERLATSGSPRLSYPASWSLRIGGLIFGMGAGLLLGAVLDRCLHFNAQYWSNAREVIFGGSMLCLGGLGLLVAFVVEYMLYRKACKENK